MENRVYGYARVSSRDQNLDRQIAALTSYGVPERDIIIDKQSGKDFDRAGYMNLKTRMLRSGDCLVVKELDRLGRDYNKIKEEWNALRGMGVDIVIIDTPLLNTANKSDLEKNLISNIIFELFAYMSQKKRDKIKSRQSEGIEQAKLRGKRFGRPPIPIPDNFIEEYVLWKSGAKTAVAAMKKLGLKRNTFYKLVRMHELKG